MLTRGRASEESLEQTSIRAFAHSSSKTDKQQNRQAHPYTRTKTPSAILSYKITIRFQRSLKTSPTSNLFSFFLFATTYPTSLRFLEATSIEWHRNRYDSFGTHSVAATTDKLSPSAIFARETWHRNSIKKSRKNSPWVHPEERSARWLLLLVTSEPSMRDDRLRQHESLLIV